MGEIHARMCSSHIQKRALVGKAFREGFYWPSAVADAHDVVRMCPNCQQHTPYSKFPPDEVQLLPPVWPLARWGIDIVGPLLTAPGNYKYVAVAVEYFSKWIEAKALRDITARALQKFFWQNIVCRFGVPKEVTVDNGHQFDCATFRDFSTQLGTSLCFDLVYHPKSNGTVERANGIIFASIKKNITELPKGKWVDEQPRVVWSHNTIESRTTKFTPFELLYGEEAVTPEVINLGSWRTIEGAKKIEEDMKPSIDKIEVGKMHAAINLGRYQEEMRRWKNKKVKPREMKKEICCFEESRSPSKRAKCTASGKAHSSSHPWQGQRPAGFARWKAPKTCIPRTRICCKNIMCGTYVRARGGK